MGNQPSRVNNAQQDNTTINDGMNSSKKPLLRVVGVDTSNGNGNGSQRRRRGVSAISEENSDYRSSDYNEMNKLANARDWTKLLEKFRANPGYALYRDAKNHGCLPLHRALLKCASFELIEFLLSSEAHGEESIHIADENGLKPLHYACLYNYCMEKHFETLRDERDKTSGKGYMLKLLIEKI